MTGPVHGRHIPILTPSLIHKHLLFDNLEAGECLPATCTATMAYSPHTLPLPPSSLSLLAAIDDLVKKNVCCFTHGPFHQSGCTVHKCTKLIRTHDAIDLF